MLSHYCSFAHAAELLKQDNVLAVMPLTTSCKPADLGVIQTGVPFAAPENDGDNAEALGDLSKQRALAHEVWEVDGHVKRGQDGKCQWSKSDDIMCAAVWLSDAECQHIEQTTCDAYIKIFEVLRQHGFPLAFRAWNYLPDINHGEGDEEVYKLFCTGRLRAFESLGIAPSAFPAASGLGHHSQGAVIYVFASREEPIHFKNNRQVNAYEYPRQYGMSSPSFARASALTIKDSSHLFISGTASIVGHKTLKIGDLLGQLEVTVHNIEHLLETANPHNKALSTFKVYVRRKEHLVQTKQWLNKHYPNVHSIITLADICRSDLLVEIEGFCE